MPARTDTTSHPHGVQDLRVSLIGAGLMGHSIAGVFASARADVAIYDPDPAVLEAVHGRVRGQLVGLNRDPSASEQIRLVYEIEQAVAGAHLVIEAIPEDLVLKQRLFERLGDWLPDAVLATNTSSLRIADVAIHTRDQTRVVGTHWFNPPHLIPVVEVVQSEATAPRHVAWLIDLLAQTGKVPVHVRKDSPGFIANRIQHAMWREAISLVEHGVCDAETVDLVVRNSFGLRLAAMGPLENADFVGLDMTLAVHKSIFPTLCADEYPSPLLQELVAAGSLGAKTGSGFLKWEHGQQEEAAHRLEQQLLDQLLPDDERGARAD